MKGASLVGMEAESARPGRRILLSVRRRAAFPWEKPPSLSSESYVAVLSDVFRRFGKCSVKAVLSGIWESGCRRAGLPGTGISGKSRSVGSETHDLFRGAGQRPLPCRKRRPFRPSGDILLFYWSLPTLMRPVFSAANILRRARRPGGRSRPEARRSHG